MTHLDPLAPECGDLWTYPTRADAKRLIRESVGAALENIHLRFLAVEQTATTMEATMADYREEIDAINAETDSLSTRIDAVLASLDVDDPAVEAELGAISARLRGLAADPANPVPPVEEEPAPADPVDGEQPA